MLEACEKRCADCPGPEAPNGCHTRKFPRTVAGRADWPMCPLGLTRVAFWRSCVDRYFAALISPLAGWPDSHTAVAHDCMVELKVALNREDRRKADAATQDASGGGPDFSGRRTARGDA